MKNKDIKQGKILTGKVTSQTEMRYLVYLPEGYGEKGKKWPLIIYLHGAGERGDDLEKVKCNGWPLLIEQSKKFGFIIVAPQCPLNDWWTDYTKELKNLTDYIKTEYNVDSSRVYLTGLSMGGFGTWRLAEKYSQDFAAIVPICGGGDSLWMGKNLKTVPIWAFHGAKDDIVPLKRSQEMVDAVNAAGGNAKLTIWPDAKHDSWTEAYKTEELYKWLLSHKR
jgi:predicted peptidase